MSRAGLIFMGTGLTLWELRNHCVADNEALDLEMEEPPKPPKRCCSNSCLFTLAKEVPGDILDQNDLPEARDEEEEDGGVGTNAVAASAASSNSRVGSRSFMIMGVSAVAWRGLA